MIKLGKNARVLTLFGIGFGLMLVMNAQRTKAESEYLEFLHSLRGSNITKIVISDDASNSGAVVASVSSGSALDAFARAAHASELCRSNHRSYVRQFFVEVRLADGTAREFEFNTMSHNRKVYLDFVQRSGGVTAFYGHGECAALFGWLQEQMPGVNLLAPAAAPSLRSPLIGR